MAEFVLENYDSYLDSSPKKSYKVEIVWRNVFLMLLIHILGIYGLFGALFANSKLSTLVWNWFLGTFSGLGILAGAHRLWSHKSYKATWQLRTILMIANTLALQNDIYEWSRDHRVHHKYSETDADPHNSNRGFFFSHVGWLLCKKHPEVRAKGKALDLSDLWSDPIVRFQRKYYVPLVFFIWGLIPVLVPIYFWGESFLMSIALNMFRYIVSLHQTWFVNSFAHMWGMRPYDRHIGPRENRGVVYATMGEGYHNYHHTFPWDYSASEYGWEHNFNPATAFIEFCEKIGWAYDLRKPYLKLVKQRQERTGDRSHIRLWTKPKNWWMDFFCGWLAICWSVVLIIGARLLVSLLSCKDSV